MCKRRIIFFLLPMLMALYFQTPVSADGIFAAPDTERISRDVHYLASDALEGRLPGTKGCELAAEYIKEQFESAGLLPGNEEHGDYYQEFDITNGVTLGPENNLTITTAEGSYVGSIETDYLPLFFSKDDSVQGEVVFAGYGITAEQYGWDDYAELDVVGKIIFCLRDEPGKDDPQNAFDGILPTMYSGLRWKAFNAEAHGAVALIVATGPAFLEEGEEDEFITLGQVGGLGESGIPVIQVSQDIANLLFSTMKAPLAMFHGEMERHGMAFGAALENVTVKLSVDLERQYVTTNNVVGILPGADPQLADEWVIVGAHYDHLGWGTDASLHRGEREIHNGADDNASGTAGVLELARLFAASVNRPKRSILFICFSAEELGVLGSSAYLKTPLVPTGNLTAMINMDQIGRVRPDEDGILYCSIHGTGSALEWDEIVTDVTLDGLVEFRQLPDPIGGSDYTNFYLEGVPVLNFFSGLHEDCHRPSDDADKINYDGEASVIAGIYEIVEGVANYPDKLTFQEGDVSSGAFSQDVGAKVTYGVYLGTIPDFNRTEGGFWIAGVSPGSPAEDAGLMAGDRILRLGEYNVSDIYTYTYALGEYEPGDTVEIVVLRNDEELTLEATFGTRDG